VPTGAHGRARGCEELAAPTKIDGGESLSLAPTGQ